MFERRVAEGRRPINNFIKHSEVVKNMDKLVYVNLRGKDVGRFAIQAKPLADPGMVILDRDQCANVLSGLEAEDKIDELYHAGITYHEFVENMQREGLVKIVDEIPTSE